MNLQEMCEPAKNPQLAEMLRVRDISINSPARSIMRINPDGQAGIAYGLGAEENFTNGRGLLLVLFPNMGTGVVAHPNVVEEKVIYLGPILGGEKTELACKSQMVNSPNREISQDATTRYIPGQEFFPISPGKDGGYYHGFHNLNTKTPVALLIQRIFYDQNLTESL